MAHTHMSKPVCEEGDVTVLWNQLVHTDREVTPNRPDIIPLVQEKHQEEMPVTETSISYNSNKLHTAVLFVLCVMFKV